jgi:uncharacterized protein (DUF2062 family)
LHFLLYIDPGLGAMLIQSVIAGIAAAGLFFFAIRKRISAWFASKSKSKNKSDVKSADTDDEGK